MRGYTLDTNIVTALLKGNDNVLQKSRQALLAGFPVMLNAVSYYETKRGLLLPPFRAKLSVFEHFCSLYGVVPLDRAALDKAAEIYASLREAGMLLEDADILMAAIAIVHDLALVTANVKHFERIPGLSLENWLV